MITYIVKRWASVNSLFAATYTHYNRPMRLQTGLISAALFTAVMPAQNPPKLAPQPETKSVTVPITLDHSRVVIDVDLSLPDGSTNRIRGWVDNGGPDLYLSRRLATQLGLNITCGEHECSAPPPREIVIGGVKISLAAVKEAKIPLKPVAAAAVLFAGVSAEINIPSTVLRNYDVLINFPGHELTLAPPGTLKFNGVKAKVIVNPENGLVQVPSQIENKKYNLALDAGSSISFLAEELFDKLASGHPDWPHMTGAVGPANIWGLDDEPTWKLMRLDRLQYGPLFLTNVAVVEFPKDRQDFFEKRAGIPTAGLLGADLLANYRVGLDYVHSTVYFEIGRLFNFPEFDVIGLILRPEDDGGFTILGMADYDGKPTVPEAQAGDHLIAIDGIPVSGSTLGQVWLMLGGVPGKERRLTVERIGKQFTIAARVQHFLGEINENDKSKGKSRNN
jgi:hypothetical protein